MKYSRTSFGNILILHSIRSMNNQTDKIIKSTSSKIKTIIKSL